MKKLLLNTSIAALAMVPIVGLVSCSDGNLKSSENPITTIDTKNRIDSTIGANNNQITMLDINRALSVLENTVVSTKNKTTLNVFLSSITANSEVDASLLGLPDSYSLISDGMSISYTIETAYDNTSGVVKVYANVSSIDNSELTAKKIITITAKTTITNNVGASGGTGEIDNQGIASGTETSSGAGGIDNQGIASGQSTRAYNFNNELNYFDKVISYLTFELLNSKVNSDHPTAEQLGIPKMPLSDGTTATYTIIDHNFAEATPKAVTVTLHHGLESQTKVFDLTPVPTIDMNSYLSQIHDTIISTKDSQGLKHDATTQILTAEQLGIVLPTIRSDLRFNFSISDYNFVDGTAKKVTVRLTRFVTHDPGGLNESKNQSQSVTKIFNLIPAPSYYFNSDLAQFDGVLTSSKDARMLNDSITAIMDTASLHGITIRKMGLNESLHLSHNTIARFKFSNYNFVDGVAKICTVTLTNGNQHTSKDFQFMPAPSYDFSNDLTKFQDIKSSKDAQTLNRNRYETPEWLGFSEPSLASGVTAVYKIIGGRFVEGEPREIIVTLHHGAQSDSKVFHLTPKRNFDFTDDLAKLNDVISTKTAGEILKHATQWRRDMVYSNGLTMEKIAKDYFGIPVPKLSTGTQVDLYLLSWNGKKLELLIALRHGTSTTRKKIEIIPKFDFSADKSKFTSFTSTKTATELNHDVDSDSPTPEQLGFTEPTDLSSGTTATYKIENHTFVGTTAKVVTVTLTHDGQIDTQTFNLIPKP